MGAGYVGMALLKQLQNHPYHLFITTTQKERIDILQPYAESVILLNSNKAQQIQALIDMCDALIVLVAPKNSQSYKETYLHTAEIITRATQHKREPFYILYTSSTAVCEGIQDPWITELTPLSPLSDNAQILLETEQCYLNSGIPTCILRLGGIYGPGREFISRASYFSGKDLPGTGSEPTNHIHLDDIVSAILFCLSHSLTGVYNLVNEDHPSKQELYSRLCQNLHIPAPRWDPLLPSKRGCGSKVSNQKIKDAGFVFSYPNL